MRYYSSMKDLPPAFRVNSPDVLAETVDGEVLIINLASGVYYTVRGTGDHAWQLLSSGYPVKRLAGELAEHFGADEATVATDVEAWLRSLVEEEIIVAAEPGGEGVTLPPARGPWSPPVFEKYTDMQDLLILDPVHEVADEGWPKAANVS